MPTRKLILSVNELALLFNSLPVLPRPDERHVVEVALLDEPDFLLLPTPPDPDAVVQVSKVNVEFRWDTQQGRWTLWGENLIVVA